MLLTVPYFYVGFCMFLYCGIFLYFMPDGCYMYLNVSDRHVEFSIFTVIFSVKLFYFVILWILDTCCVYVFVLLSIGL